jgi:hypothetical protein
MPGRVEEHPEGGAGLVLVPGRAEFGHRRLGGVEVVDDDVQMHLLGHLLSGPACDSQAGTLPAIPDDSPPDYADLPLTALPLGTAIPGPGIPK